jgi:hypothetical protein
MQEARDRHAAMAALIRDLKAARAISLESRATA